ncbi:MAG: S66 peptidase family protein [Flavobacteriaceae bacterium]|nr:LD-carboxypeptidase [Psychroflexus sp.]
MKSVYFYLITKETPMHIPPALQKGDQVAIIATARKVQPQELEPAINLLESWGLEVIIGNSIGLKNHQFAGSDQERAADLQTQINNPNIKAIWCAKGGYGSVRILDLVDFIPLLKQPKWLIGYSDVTAIHSELQKIGLCSLHAQMCLGFEDKTKETMASLRSVLFGEKINYKIQAHHFNQQGKAEGRLVGGNLSMIYSLCGSPSAIDPDNAILLIEDLDEYLYHIDRMMQNLKRNGYFEKLKGVIVGGMTDMNDNTIPFGKTAEEIISEILQAYDFPVLFNFPAGHISDNRALILGQKIVLDVNTKGGELLYK